MQMLSAVLLSGALTTAGTILATPTPVAQAAGCQFLEGGGPAAFCDTFATPSGSNTRAGDLDPVVWGVSRLGGPENPGQNQTMAFAGTVLNKCGTQVAVTPPHDVAICNGKLVESLNDDGGLAQLAMYPRQPFDIAGRTGHVVFDVSDDSMGSHAAWPEFSYTDQPVPVPGPSQIAFAGFGEPQNSVNLSFAGNTNGCVTVDNIWITSNYAMTQGLQVADGCMQEPTQNSLTLNHVEIELSPSGVVVFGSDAGTTTMKQIAHASYASPLTRGLVWMKDTHYNAAKPFSEGAVPFDQQTHTFAWGNFGFDGPTLPRDLGAELPDGNAPSGTAQSGQPQQNLYFDISKPVTFNLPSTLGNESVQGLSGVENAQAALLEMSAYSFNPGVVISYAVNGNPAHTYSRALSGPNYNVQPFAMPVPVSELHDGANSVVISASNTGGAAQAGNVDIILVGAGAGGSSGGSPTPAATSTPTTLPAATATSTTAPAATATPTPTLPGVGATATPIATAPPTPVPTQPGGAWTVLASVSDMNPVPGEKEKISLAVKSVNGGKALVDVEIFGPSPNWPKVNQQVLDNQTFAAGQTRTYSFTYVLPSGIASGTYVMNAGVFSPGWGTVFAYQNAAAVVSIK